MKYDQKEGDESLDFDSVELESILKAELDDAKDFIDQVEEDRTESTDYYLGNAPHNSSDMQSEYISTDVRDSVLFMLPQIMRTFFGSNKVVEFMPRSAEDVAMANQQTEYINHIITQKNNGFQVMYDVFKDALIRKTGFVKAFWNEDISSTTHDFNNLTEQEYMALAMDEDIEIVKETVKQEMVMVADPMTGQEIEQQTPANYDLTVRRIKAKRQVIIESIPPEEILISRNARSLEESPYVAHRKVCTVSDLVALGYDKDDIDQYAGTNEMEDAQDARDARNPYGNDLNFPDRSDNQGKNVFYVEHYLYYDLDDDGIDELIKCCTVGNAMNIINVEHCDELPIVMFCPDPEPHTSIGSCPTDYLKPIQAAKSQIMRDTLDSLGHAIFPRMGVVEGQVNIDDVLNTDIGQPIRMRQAGAVQPFSVPFVGKEAFPVLGYLDQQVENRTGTSKAAAGLNADALQSSTKAAVSATVSAAQGRIELICRHFAESGLKPLFKLVNSLVVKHQDKEDIFRLNNEFIPVDPRYWDADKDVIINVAISKNSDEEKFQVLTALASKQEQIMQTLGPQNPLVNMQQYANTLAKMIELAGFKDVDTFVNTKIQQQQPQQPAQDAKPSPEDMIAQAELMKAQVSAQKMKVDSETDRLKIIMDDDLQRDKFEAEAQIKATELIAKYGAQINMNQISALMERDKEVIRQQQKQQSLGLFNNNNNEQQIS